MGFVKIGRGLVTMLFKIDFFWFNCKLHVFPCEAYKEDMF